ncbi:MAG: response regulator transcription factor [Coriobacteriia bacterium]|nr:response regulator transcription factor [Coriobacteriia bacterium]
MATETSRILVVEHSLSVVERIIAALESKGHAVEAQPNAATALRTMQQEEETFDLFVISTSLPGTVDGYELCRCLRLVTQAPILMISDRNKELDKIIGFEVGADDYLAKPFSDPELCARVQSLLRRSTAAAPAADQAPEKGLIQASGISLDENAHTAFHGETEIQLTPREFELLSFLMRNAGNVVSREDLLREAWGWDYLTTTKTVDTHIKRLRDKIRNAGVDPKVIETVRGYGYRFHE